MFACVFYLKTDPTSSTKEAEREEIITVPPPVVNNVKVTKPAVIVEEKPDRLIANKRQRRTKNHDSISREEEKVCKQLHEKTCFLYNKGKDQLCGNHAADQPLCFPYIESTTCIPLLPKSEISSL